MSHHPNQHPISQLRRLIEEHSDTAYTEHMLLMLDAIEDDRAKLKRSFKEKAVQANAAKLRIAYLGAELARERVRTHELVYSINELKAAIPPMPKPGTW